MARETFKRLGSGLAAGDAQLRGINDHALTEVANVDVPTLKAACEGGYARNIASHPLWDLKGLLTRAVRPGP